MTRHPTTQQLRNTLATLIASGGVETTPLSPREQALKAEREARPEVEDATIGNEDRLRGIPCVGRVSGTMRGTRPGDGLHL